jgi:lysine 6-dehydrogenase
MKFLILGSGLMGPAAAYNAMIDPDVSRVTLCDLDQQQLDAAQAKLSGMQGGEKLDTVTLDVSDEDAAAQLMADFDVVLGALPLVLIPAEIRAAVAAKTPLVDLYFPVTVDAAGMAALRQQVEAAGITVVLGCGVGSPGMTEMSARYLAEKLDRVDELYVRCGGIPENPKPPLNYKIVFDGRQMPLEESDASIVENGELKAVPRYSGAKSIFFSGVGECEEWLEDFPEWLLEMEILKGLKYGAHTTIRWPGYAAKVTVLKEMGMLSEKPVEVDGVQVAPKSVLDAVLYPHVKMEEGERDITLFRTEVKGEKDGQPRKYLFETVDRYDDVLGFTSMARTTGFTGAIIARMIARGDLKVKRMFMSEQAVFGPLFDMLVSELAAAGVRFTLTTTKVEPLG